MKKRVNDSLILGENRFHTVFSSLSEGIIIIDPKGQIIEANPAAMEILGFNISEIGHYKDIVTPLDLIHLDGTPMPKDEWPFIKVITANMNTSSEIMGIKRSGEKIDWINTIATRIEDTDGDLLGVVITVTNIADLMQIRENLRNLTHRIIEIQEEEKHKLARELHDQIGQSLTFTKLLLERVIKSTDDKRDKLLSELKEVIDDLIDRTSTLSLNLRPSMLDDLGLLDTVIWYIQSYTDHTGIKIDFKHSGLFRDIKPLIASCIFRVIQEALDNVLQHARVKKVLIRMYISRGILYLHILDKGIGFNSGKISLSKSIGMIGMEERIKYAGGILEVDSTPGKGTSLFITIPLSE